MFKKQNSELKSFRYLFIFIIWVSFFLSINLNPSEFSEFTYIKKIRILSPLILTIFFIIYYFNSSKINFSFDYLIFYTLFISYILFNLINSDNSIFNIFWPIYMALLLIFISYLNYSEKIYILKITIIMIFFIFIIFFSLALVDMFYSQNYHFYGVMGNNSSYFGFQNPPRSSGLSRLALIIFIALTLYFLTKNRNSKKNYFLFFLVTFFGLSVLIFQSRTTSTIFIIINLLFVIFYYQKYLKNKTIILFTFFFPIILNFVYFDQIIQHKQLRYMDILESEEENIIIVDKFDTQILKSSIFRGPQDNFSSGRFNDWKKSIEIIRRNILIGYGAQADRLYIKQSIHNASLYAYLSGGLVGFTCLILIYLKTFFFLIKFLIQKKLSSFYASFCIFVIITLNLRSILETSFAILSLDYLFYVIAYFVLKDKIIKNT